MAEAVISVATQEAVRPLPHTIATRLGYIWNYKTNFNNLQKQVEKLMDTLDQVRHSVDEAKRNGEEIEQKVEEWLKTAEKINVEVMKIIDGNNIANMRCFKSLCPDLKTRYQHSKKAAVMEMEVSKLKIKGNSLGKISYRALSKEPWGQFLTDYEDFESRRSIVEDVLKELSNSGVYMVGVYGMGGAGKTTLARVVGKQADNVFDVVVFVEVSETPDVGKIQKEIARKLGLKLHLGTESVRASELYERLQKGRENILLILDNIWVGCLEYLQKVGIPLGDDHQACKLLLTARGIDVLSNEMNCQKNFLVGDLNEYDAWVLFKKVAGAGIEEHGLHYLALEVAKRCGGLPIAIVTVAKALKGKQEQAWRSALRELKRPSLGNRGSVTAKTYACIWLSYNELNSDELKSIFLLCCTVGFTSDESVERLSRYGIGLNLFHTVCTMQEAWDKVITLVQELKNSSLLLEPFDDEQFPIHIHDVVRDVGRAIAINDHNKYTVNDDGILRDLIEKNTLKNCTSIILHNISELPEMLDCQKLEFLYVKPKTRLSKIHDNFFKGMPNLGVIHLIGMVFSPLPASFHLLKKLQTLYLDGCHLGDTVDIGKVKNLKILVLSSDINRLPEQIGELTRLKLLDLSECYNLQVIPPNTISRLTQLEELYMPSWFCNWQGVDGERSNASLDELEHLPQLTALQIYIPDVRLVPKGLVFQKLQKYKIYIGEEWWSYGLHGTSRLLVLRYDDANLSVEDGVIKQLKEIEELQLIGKQGVKNVLYELNRDGFPKLKRFYVESNLELVYLVDFTKQLETCVAFPHLQTLFLKDLSSLEKICHGQFSSSYSFCQLRTINVDCCVKLKNIFSSSIARHLSQLQKIKVLYCENMEEIFSIVGSENEEIVLEKLDSLYLGDLPQLRSFSYEEEVGSTSDQERQMKDTLMPLFDGKVKFLNLKTLKLWEINLKYVFSSSTLGSFVLLQRLEIHRCTVLEEIIRIDDLKNNVELPSLKTLRIDKCPVMKPFIFSDKVTFPSLEEIKISDMDNLEMICHGQLSSNYFCQLRTINVQSCVKLKNIFSSSIAIHLSQLQEIKVLYCENMEEIFSIVGSENEEIVLEKLDSLYLGDLPKLRSFSYEEEVGSTSDQERQMKDTLMPLFDGKVKFLYLKSLELLEINLKYVFSASTLGSFVLLQRLEIYRCTVLEEIIRIDDLKNNVELPSLKTLWIEKCPAMKSFIFSDKVTFPSLEEIEISDMDNLEMIWHNQLEDSQNIHNCQKLCKVSVTKCQSLKNLFPASVVGYLWQLKYIYVEECGIKEVVAKDEGAEKDRTFVFPKLTSLTLHNLLELKCFYPGIHTIKWPMLKKLNTIGCDKIDASELFNIQEVILEDQLDIVAEEKGTDVSMTSNSRSPESLKLLIEDSSVKHEPAPEKSYASDNPSASFEIASDTDIDDPINDEGDKVQFRRNEMLLDRPSTSRLQEIEELQLSDSNVVRRSTDVSATSNSPPLESSKRLIEDSNVMHQGASDNSSASSETSFDTHDPINFWYDEESRKDISRPEQEGLNVSENSQLKRLPQKLKIEARNDLKSLPEELMHDKLQHLYIIDCQFLKSIQASLLPKALKSLHIRRCKKLEFLSAEETMGKHTSIETLCIESSCNPLKSFPLALFPKLKNLTICDCTNFNSISITEDHMFLNSLEIRDCTNLESLWKSRLHTPNLISVLLSNCKNLKQLPGQLHELTSLQSLFITECPELDSIPEGGLPSSLNLLRISSCHKLTPSLQWGLDKLNNFSRIEIEGGCRDLKSFPEQNLLPTNLNSLQISRFLNLKVLNYEGLQHLKTLETLKINSCDKLQSLPEEGLPSSLSYLYISDCPMLKSKLQNRRGTEWYKIAHIPHIQIDGKVIS